jgi:hypothetical protein
MGPALKPAPDGQQSYEEMLAMLTLEEKITLLTGADYWSLRGHCDKPHPPAEASVEGEPK